MIGALKVAILLEWMRIFNPTSTRNSFFWTCHTILWINVLFYSASFFAINLACFPREKIWDVTIIEGHCIDQNNLYLAGTIVNLISDVAILFIPQKVIWTLNMSLHKRIGVSLIFAIGLLCVSILSNDTRFMLLILKFETSCCGIAGARIATTLQSPNEPDAIYNLPKLVFLGTAEMLCALLVFCVPAFPQAINNLGIPKIISQISLLLSSRKPTQEQSWGNSGGSWQPKGYPGEQVKSYQQIDEHSLKPLNKPNAAPHGDIC
jgi:hypothetical protein